MQTESGDSQAALTSLNQAYSLSPDDFTIRYELARTLFRLKQFEESEPHFRWCYSQRPDIEFIHAALTQVSRDKMQRLASNSHVRVP
jgi:hypothetical protein